MKLAAVVLIGFSLPAAAATCPLPADIQTVIRLEDVPAPVLAALRSDLPNIKPHDKTCNLGDVVLPGHDGLDRCFERGLNRGARWVIDYWQAGIGSFELIRIYDVSAAGKVSLVGKARSTPGGVSCAIADAFASKTAPN
jgi:hypothetical protein